MSKEKSKWNGWKDSVEILISLWMLLAPIALGFFSVASASALTIFLGAIIFLVSQLGLAKQQPWEEWVVIILALALIISPWVLGYASVSAAVWNSLVCGGLLLVLAVLQMVEEYAVLKQGGTTET